MRKLSIKENTTNIFDFISAGRYNDIEVEDLGEGRLAITDYLDDHPCAVEIEADMPTNSFQASLLYDKCEFYKFNTNDYTVPDYRQLPNNRVRW